MQLVLAGLSCVLILIDSPGCGCVHTTRRTPLASLGTVSSVVVQGFGPGPQAAPAGKIHTEEVSMSSSPCLQGLLIAENAG